MQLSYSQKRNLFYVQCSYEERSIPRQMGFEFVERARAWCTRSPFVAFSLREHADASAKPFFASLEFRYAKSWAIETEYDPPVPSGCELMPFQRAGVEWAVRAQMRRERSACIADPMGCGKSPMGVAVANALGAKGRNVLVICPASLRINWGRELNKWSTCGGRAEIVIDGKTRPPRRGPLVISYTLASSPAWAEFLSWSAWDLVIFDEAHYLKNRDAGRTQELLGTRERKGLIDRAGFVLTLTGTPIPNRPHEFFYPIKRLAPHVIDDMGWARFESRFMDGFEDVHGYRATGAKHHEELHNRLRASGWMIRREKELVLPQLPPKRYNLVVFPQDSTTAKIIEKESTFSAREIIEHGVPVGVAALPELRKEMGIAKVPDCVAWIKDALDGGMEKLLVFAHHTEVIDALAEGLKDYKPVVIYGATTMARRQAAVDAFQSDPEVRLVIGSFIPAGVGWTLVAAHDVVFAEGSWVPSDNEQCIDRAHRIGQTAESVNIYFLVVEGSLDAHILGTAAKKAADIKKVLG